MRPSVTYGINPSFEKYYDQYIIDANGNTSEYTRFEGGFFGIPGNNFSSAVGLGLSNILEAKVKDRDSTILEPKKIKLLNNLNLSTSYNIAADSLNWSPIRMTTGTTLFDNKLNINLGATFDPYAINENGSRINKFNINNKGGLFRMTSANINMGFSFSSKNSKDDKSESSGLNNTRSGGRDDDLFGRVDDFADSSFDEEEDEEEDSKKEDSKFYNNKMPWDIRLAHSLTYSNNKAQKQITNNSLMFSGNISLSKKWKIGGSSGYDFKNSGVTYTQLRFERDLDSWKMNFNWVPFSTRASWYFFIGIKSSLLSDLKYDKRRLPDKRL
jgi:hypothetical protein